MSTSRLEMMMASNVQTAANAFQLAESAADTYIAEALDNAACINDLNPGVCDMAAESVAEMNGRRSASNRFVEYIDNCPVTPQKGNSINATAAFHFMAEASGTSDYRGATATHTQGWYVCRAN